MVNYIDYGIIPLVNYALRAASTAKGSTTVRGYSMSNSTRKCKKCGSTERYKNGTCALCAREYSRKWRAANPEKKRKSNRRWKHDNPERNRELNRRCRKSNPEDPRKHRERSRRWKKENPYKNRVKDQRYRARRRGNISESYDFKAICEHYDNRCVKCGEKKPLTVDHILPISKGGPDIASNIQPLCLSCNSSKGARHIDYRRDAGPRRWVQRKLFGGV